MSVKDGLLCQEQKDALERFSSVGGFALVNYKRDGFNGVRARDAVTLIIAGLAYYEAGELHLSELGRELVHGAAQLPIGNVDCMESCAGE